MKIPNYLNYFPFKCYTKTHIQINLICGKPSLILLVCITLLFGGPYILFQYENRCLQLMYWHKSVYKLNYEKEMK